MLDAHAALLRAELELVGKEIGVIVGLALGALAVLILVAILLYVGSFLFLAEWLFGSMGWGIIHGTLLGAAIIGFAAINLAGGEVRAYGAGAIIGLVVTVAMALLLLSNLGNEGGEALREWLVEEFVTEQLPFGDEWLVLLGGLAIGAVVGLVAGLLVSWRAGLSGSGRVAVAIGLALAGALASGLWFPTRYAAPDGVLGLAITVGLLTWIIGGAALAAWRGFDTEARYANLVPRETMASFRKTKEFLVAQFDRQKDRMMGR
jgi:hypothetical protein